MIHVNKIIFLLIFYSSLFSQTQSVSLNIIKTIQVLPGSNSNYNRLYSKRINRISEAGSAFDGRQCDFLVRTDISIHYFDRKGNLVAEKYNSQNRKRNLVAEKYNLQITNVSHNSKYFLIMEDKIVDFNSPVDFKSQGGYRLESVRLEDVSEVTLWKRDSYEKKFLNKYAFNRSIVTSNGTVVTPPAADIDARLDWARRNNLVVLQEDYQNLLLYYSNGAKEKIPFLHNYQMLKRPGVSTVSPEGNYYFVNFEGLDSSTAGSVLALFDLKNKKVLWSYKFLKYYSGRTKISLNAKYIICPGGINERNSKMKCSLFFLQKDGPIIKTINFPNDVDVKAISPDGLFSAVETREQNGHSFSLYFNPTGKMVWKYLCEGKDSCIYISISNNGDYVSTICRCDDSPTLLIFNKQGTIVLRKKTDHGFYNRISPDGKYLWLANSEGEILYHKLDKL
jgi:hypothetical protein